MNAFLWFLAIVSVSWILIIFILPLVGKIFLRKLSKRFQDHVKNSQRTESRPEGSVHIEHETSKPKINPEAGDYVNFEEITDK